MSAPHKMIGKRVVVKNDQGAIVKQGRVRLDANQHLVLDDKLDNGKTLTVFTGTAELEHAELAKGESDDDAAAAGDEDAARDDAEGEEHIDESQRGSDGKIYPRISGGLRGDAMGPRRQRHDHGGGHKR